ncbi:DNA replication and repair protein RecF [Vibrio stylophorae]|uniref:DNA replication and repair protein RecF n=1 Tax=Vibrio stylophorae TaxID=659351 RepID=A0ABM8ZWQ6_9VIBR|nr:DNA replication/repair protein RecF [Vibrio stylophorae]CAH0534770.1 DNA replication and repair protein RecF [Vibrio stylophorae]
MALDRLVVTDFRNIEHCDLSFSSHMNILVGDNGSGKTSLLEAIFFLGHGRSFRSQLTNRVIRHQQAKLVLFGQVLDQHNSKLPLGLAKGRDGQSEVKLGGEKQQTLAQLANVLPIQLITPEGFTLLAGGPKYRRAYIDWGVFHQEPQFFELWRRVKRITKQRNALLKTVRTYQPLAVWDAELSRLSEQVSALRQGYIEQLLPRVETLCQAFLPEYQCQLKYSRGWDADTPLQTVLEQNFQRDSQFGYTTVGPHKADLRLRINGTPVEDVLSRGQLKLLVCALRLAQGQDLTQTTGKQCIYLIDDFASELDAEKRGLLAQQLAETRAQVFISCISADQVSEMMIEQPVVFHVKQGEISQQ